MVSVLSEMQGGIFCARRAGGRVERAGRGVYTRDVGVDDG